jgi:hypothetical protein
MAELIESKYHEANKMLLRLRREVTEKLDSSSTSVASTASTLHHRGAGSIPSTNMSDEETSLNSLMVDINALSRKIADLDPLIAPLYAAKKQFWTVHSVFLFLFCAQFSIW